MTMSVGATYCTQPKSLKQCKRIAHQLVNLGKGRLVNVQPLDCDAIERGVVQHHGAVGVLDEALEGEDGVVRLHHHVAHFVILLREHRVRLHQLLWKSARQTCRCRSVIGALQVTHDGAHVQKLTVLRYRADDDSK